MDEVKARPPISVSATLDLLRRQREEACSDDLVVVSSDTVSLKCPLTLVRIAVPCRGAACAHAQSFDLAGFLALAERHARWACPVCEARLSPEELRVDELTLEALRLHPCADAFAVGDGGLSAAATHPTTHSTPPRACSAARRPAGRLSGRIRVIPSSQNQSPPRRLPERRPRGCLSGSGVGTAGAVPAVRGVTREAHPRRRPCHGGFG